MVPNKTSATSELSPDENTALSKLVGESWKTLEEWESGYDYETIPVVEGVTLDFVENRTPDIAGSEGAERWEVYCADGFQVELDIAFEHPENDDLRIRVTKDE